MSLPGTRLSFVLGTNRKSERLDAIVVALLKDAGRVVSRSTVRQWVDEGRVRVDGIVAKPAARPAAGVRIDVDPAPAPPSAAEPDPSVHVEILHADEHLLVVNKPAGLVVHPARGHVTGTLVNGLLAHHCFDPSVVDATDPDATFRPGIVHRLDKDTSGVLVVARTGTAREGLKKLFASHDIDREYQAVVVGHAVDATYDTAYGRHPTNRLKFTSKSPAGDKRAITHVRVQERLAGDGATLVRCRLETGRTHQIRVHLCERGVTPVLGDALYGPSATNPRVRVVAESLGRHWLHAGLLAFVHPVTSEAMRFESPVPPELLRALEALRDSQRDSQRD